MIAKHVKNDKKHNLADINNLPSERSFGILFVLVFGIFGAYGLYKNWNQFIASTFLLISFSILQITLLKPNILLPFNKGWHWLGQAMGKIVNPIVLGFIFFLIITPIAFFGKKMGRDELRLKKRDIKSYWIERKPNGPAPDSFKQQF